MEEGAGNLQGERQQVSQLVPFCVWGFPCRALLADGISSSAHQSKRLVRDTDNTVTTALGVTVGLRKEGRMRCDVGGSDCRGQEMILTHKLKWAKAQHQVIRGNHEFVLYICTFFKFSEVPSLYILNSLTILLNFYCDKIDIKLIILTTFKCIILWHQEHSCCVNHYHYMYTKLLKIIPNKNSFCTH